MASGTRDLQGVLVAGHQIASGKSQTDRRFPLGAIRMQAPLNKEQGLDLDAYFGGDWYPGTLNISIAPYTFEIVRPDFKPRQIKWTDVFPPENFLVAGITGVFEGRRFRGLLYQPDPKTKPDHFQPPEVMEIIAPYIPGAAYGDKFKLSIDTAKISLVEPDARFPGRAPGSDKRPAP